MKKSANVDIRNLFHKFGGEPETYQEIKRDHAEGQAQQSWPIVAAMKNELQSAPRLRAAAPANIPSAPVPHAPASPVSSGHGLFAAQANAPVARPKPAAGADRAGVSTAMASTPAPSSGGAGPARSLFGSLGATAGNSTAVTPPAQTGQMPGRGLLAQAGSAQQNDQLDAVFSRLLNPQKTDTSHAPQNSLRSMLGFLKK